MRPVVARVGKGQRFTVALSRSHHGTKCSFYWLPFGNGSAIHSAMSDAEQLADPVDGAQPRHADIDAEA